MIGAGIRIGAKFLKALNLSESSADEEFENKFVELSQRISNGEALSAVELKFMSGLKKGLKMASGPAAAAASMSGHPLIGAGIRMGAKMIHLDQLSQIGYELSPQELTVKNEIKKACAKR